MTTLPITIVRSQWGNADRVFAELDALEFIRVGTTPRDEYFVSDVGEPYTYGAGDFARTYHPQPWSPMLRSLQILAQVMSETEVLDLCFLNRYHHGRDHLGWHADDSPEMDDERPIVIMSFGASREIHFRSNADPKKVYVETMRHGDAIVMHAGMQDTHQHRIPKSGDQRLGKRISLTWRGFADGSHA